MRIAVLTNAYPPQARGGAGRIAARQVELLQAEGQEVRVWSTSLDWTAYSFVRRLWFHLRDFAWIHPSAEEIITWKPDALITHNLTGVGFRTPSSIKKTLSSQGVALRWLHILHDVQLFHPLGLLKDEKSTTGLQRVVTLFRKRVFRRPDVVISPTEWLLRAHTRRSWFQGVETVVIPNPAPPLESTQQTSWSSSLKALFIGRVSPDKGSEVLKGLIQAASRPIEWHVIGAQSDTLKKISLPSRSSISVRAESSSEVVLQAMREADVLLVPSQIEENQPTVILEAFAIGLPVIGQAKGGIPETIGTAGVTVQTGEAVSWLTAIAELTSEPREVWSTRAQQAWQRHAPERVVEALLGVLKSNKKI